MQKCGRKNENKNSSKNKGQIEDSTFHIMLWQMLKAPPVNPRAYISPDPKLDPGEGC